MALVSAPVQAADRAQFQGYLDKFATALSQDDMAEIGREIPEGFVYKTVHGETWGRGQYLSSVQQSREQFEKMDVSIKLTRLTIHQNSATGHAKVVLKTEVMDGSKRHQIETDEQIRLYWVRENGQWKIGSVRCLDVKQMVDGKVVAHMKSDQ